MLTSTSQREALRQNVTSDRASGPAPGSTGVGLKAEHYQDILNARPGLDWFEIHPENYMGHGGAPHRYLERFRQDYALSMHSVGCSLGSAEPVASDQLDALKRLVDRYDPFLVSDHLSWSATGGVFLNDLLPLPLTQDCLDAVARNVDHMQTHLGRRILVENPSTYLQFQHDAMPEPEFLRALTQRTGCGLLLDINNVYVCAQNHGFDPWAYLTALPQHTVGEIHLAGHALDVWTDDTGESQEIRVDDHGSPVADAVWALFERYVHTYGAPVTLIEWDANLPDFATLNAEATQARAIIDSAITGKRHAGAA